MAFGVTDSVKLGIVTMHADGINAVTTSLTGRPTTNQNCSLQPTDKQSHDKLDKDEVLIRHSENPKGIGCLGPPAKFKIYRWT